MGSWAVLGLFFINANGAEEAARPGRLQGINMSALVGGGGGAGARTV